MNKLKIHILSLLLVCISFGLFAQEREKPVVDEILAVVGSQVILKSDIERQLAEMKLHDSSLIASARCDVFKNVMLQKLLLNQAYIDSLKITDEQVNGEIGRRLNYFISQAGSEEALEKYYNKTIPEIKEEMRVPIKEVLLVRQMKEKIIGKQQVSPKEIQEFFEKIPKDSLPFYNTEVEVSQIVIYPKPTVDEQRRAKNKLMELRERIMKGENFDNLAILYSEDDGSATKGGDLGIRNKSDFVPEFGYAAMKLKKDSVSEIIQTKYGYHLIKMIDRKGEQIHVRHILIKPQLTNDSKNKAFEQLKQIRVKIKSDSIKFTDAAFKYSEDENSKNSGGVLTDLESGSVRVSLDKLDATLFFVIDTMKAGQLSPPVKYTAMDGRTAYRLIYLKSKMPPHKANLSDDYPKLQEMAENYKSIDILDKWVKKAVKNIFFQVKAPYNSCDYLKELQTN